MMHQLVVLLFLLCFLGASSKGLQGLQPTKRFLHDDADNDNNPCYSDQDNFDVALGAVIDDTNTDRGDYFKCIPAGSYAVAGLWYAKHVYSSLYKLHHDFCIHVDFKYTPALHAEIEKFVLLRPPYYCPDMTSDCVNLRRKPFDTSFTVAGDGALKLFGTTSKIDAATTCTDDKRAFYTFTFDWINSNVQPITMAFEHETGQNIHYDLTKFSLCGTHSSGADEGGACLWYLFDLNKLPADQQGGFDNTELRADLNFPVYRSFIDPNIPTGNEDEIILQEFHNNAYKHCHYTPSNNGMLRTMHFQHTLERNYPTGKKQICFCDWRQLAKLVTRCDCTLDGSANNNCGATESAALSAIGVTCNNC